MSGGLLLAVIIGCEIGFWILLVAGLLTRYLLKQKKLSTVLLVSVPLIDVVLLAATVVDLGRGATATFAHGLAAGYIGFSVAFGRSTIAWADGWFARRFADGPPAAVVPTHGWALIRYELIWWLRCLLAVAVTIALVYVAIAWVDDPARTAELEPWLQFPLITAVLWFVFGPLWVTLFNVTPPKE